MISIKKIVPVVMAALLPFSFISCGSTKKVQETKVPSLGEWINVTREDTVNCGYFYTTEELGSFNMIEGEFKKDSGYDSSCYGFVFGYTGQKFGFIGDYIRFEINTKGEYALYSFDGSTYKDLADPSVTGTAYMVSDSSIKSGFGSVNKLKVEKLSDGTYSCYINGSRVASGIKPFKDATDGVMAFFSVGKENQEDFPDTPVDFSYRITASSSSFKNVK